MLFRKNCSLFSTLLKNKGLKLQRFTSDLSKAVDVRPAEAAKVAIQSTETKVLFRTKAFNYLKQIINDYKDVGKDTWKSMNEFPFKALTYGIIFTTVGVYYKRNPNELSYEESRKAYSNQLIMCGSTFSKKSDNYLNELNKLQNAGLLEYKSFVLFSLILVKRFNDFDATYERQCNELNNPNKYNIFNWFNSFLRYTSRIVDIGYCNDWYFLSKNLKDYDVDENEWKQ